MNAVINSGKYLYAVPFAIFGILHFMGGADMAESMSINVILVYLTGAALLAASVSMLIGKMDKLASVLLAAMLLIFAFVIHAPAMADNPMEMGNILKNIVMAGGALMYAQNLAKDNAVIG